MSDKMRGFPHLIIPLLVLGASGIVAQTILLRELLVLFAGNEFSLGIIFAAWVACEAAGSLVADRKCRLLPEGVNTFVFASLLFSLLFPAAIYLARLYRQLAGIPPELGIGPGQVIAASFLVLLPVAFIHGFLFIRACALYERITGTGPAAAGKVYFWETAGTIIGGVAVSYLLVPRVDSFQSALIMALINGCACALLVRACRETEWRLPVAAAAVFSLAVLAFIVCGGGERLQKSSLARAWAGKAVVACRNSYYQNITVVRNEGQFTFFTDGVPLVTTPVPDIGYVEDVVHFPLLAHPQPAEVLVLGGGAGGVIAEILKYSTVRRVDYVECDPALLAAIRDFPTPLTMAELGSPRVHLHYGDPRLYLRQTTRRYDIVLINLPLPQTLQANRLFTRECFTAVKKVMKEGGILAVPISGSLTYYGSELAKVNASCLATIAAVFPHCLVVPGDTNLLLSSTAPDVETVTPALMSARLAERGIATRLVTPDYIAVRFERERAAWLHDVLGSTAARINGDFSPMGLYYNMAFHSRLFSPQMKVLFDLVGRISLTAAIAATFVLMLFLLLLTGKYPASAVPLVISGTGFSAMIFELLLFFSFQVLYGNVYYLAGVLTAAFMGGIAAGSLLVTCLFPRFKNDRRLLLAIEGGLVIFALLLAMLFAFLARTTWATSPLVYLLLLLLLIMAGFLTGMEFPLAVRLHARRGISSISPTEMSAGLIYGADLAGGFIGGLLGGTLLLPVLGFANCCFLVAVLKAGTFLIAALAREA